jgi:hypothetical protein
MPQNMISTLDGNRRPSYSFAKGIPRKLKIILIAARPQFLDPSYQRLEQLLSLLLVTTIMAKMNWTICPSNSFVSRQPVDRQSERVSGMKSIDDVRAFISSFTTEVAGK